MTPARQRFGIAVVGSLIAVAIGAASAEGQSRPWEERAISRHLDFDALGGELSASELAELIAAGEELFSARFTVNDGAGRPLATQAIIPTKRPNPAEASFMRTAGLDSNSCGTCHNNPAVGGAGDFTVNAFVSEGFESVDFDNLDPSFSSERGSVHLFGAGLIELLAREMTTDLRALRTAALSEARATGEAATVALVTKGVDFGTITALPDGLVDLSGIEGVDTDLIVRPFSQKGVFASLRQFTINAANTHIGMQAEERFGVRWTGEDDFDGDGHADELTPGDVTAIVAFQATLPAPTRMEPEDESWRAAAAAGAALFESFGCSACHRPALPLSSTVFLDPSLYDQAGTLRPAEVAAPVAFDLAMLEWMGELERDANGDILVPLFGDLKRHQIADGEVDTLGNELLSQRFVEPDVFITAELWGVGSTEPYGHRNDLTTLDEVVRAHGGEARAARDLYVGADDEARSAIIAFLRTLVIAP